MILLPFLFLILASFIVKLLITSDWRVSILMTFLLSTFFVGFSTELLSLFNLITYRGIIGSWLFLNLLALLILIKILSSREPAQEGQKETTPKPNPSQYLGALPIISMAIIIVAGGITLFLALKSPPNNYDSMTYHMARIPHWIQNQNIRYYPTAIQRQNYSMPLAEFWILHLQLLTKSDYYANLVQWLSFMIAILTSSLIAKQFKVSRIGQWLTAAVTATLPMAILQSTSTQNDLVVGVMCLAFAYFLTETLREKRWDSTLFSALALGLALATKGTAYIFCAGIGIGLGGLALLGKKWEEIKKLGLRYGVIIAAALLLNIGIYARNTRIYHNPLITSNERVLVDRISPQIFFANLVRNSALHLATPFKTANQLIEKGTTRLLGDQIDNPDSTFQNSSFSLDFNINEDDAGNAIHFLLGFAALLILPWLNKKPGQGLVHYLVTLLLTFAIFCIAFKWQPWGGRLQTPIFLMGSVLIGAFLDKFQGKGRIPTLIILGAFLASTPYLLLNSSRPFLPLWEDGSALFSSDGERKFLAGLDKYPELNQKLNSSLSILYDGRSVVLTDRLELYFLGNFEPYYWYREACHILRNDPARNIGLIMDSNDWEYPIWVLMNEHASPGPWKMEHVAVENPSKAAGSESEFIPELILVTRDDYQDLGILSKYEQIYESQSIQVFQLTLRENQP